MLKKLAVFPILLGLICMSAVAEYEFRSPAATDVSHIESTAPLSIAAFFDDISWSGPNSNYYNSYGLMFLGQSVELSYRTYGAQSVVIDGPGAPSGQVPAGPDGELETITVTPTQAGYFEYSLTAIDADGAEVTWFGWPVRVSVVAEPVSYGLTSGMPSLGMTHSGSILVNRDVGVASVLISGAVGSGAEGGITIEATADEIPFSITPTQLNRHPNGFTYTIEALDSSNNVLGSDTFKLYVHHPDDFD